MKSAFSFETAKIVGSPTSSCWSQIHTFTPQDEEKKEKRGSLFAVFVVNGLVKDLQSIALGREILGRLHEEYYGNLTESAFERLSLSVEKVGKEYEGLEIVVASVLNDVLYLTVLGEGKILLKRGDEIGVVLEGGSQIKSASGFIKQDDLVLLGSSGFFKVTGTGVLRAALESSSPDEAVEILAPIILGRDDVANAVSIIISFQEEPEDFSIKTISSEEEIVDFPPVEPVKPETKKGIFSWLKFPLSAPKMVIREGKSKKKRLFYIIVSLILLFIFGLSLLLGLKKIKIPSSNGEIIRPVGNDAVQGIMKQ